MHQTISKQTLPNGLTVYFLVDPRYTTSSLRMRFPIGWRHDPEDMRGLAHLFEHLVGKRTTRFTEKGDFARQQSLLGVSANAFTSPEATCYYHNQTHDALLESLALLLEAIYCSQFDVNDLQKEKVIVRTEARQYRDDPMRWTWHGAARNLYNGSTLAQFPLGTPDGLENITIDTFDAFYAYYRNPTNASLFVATNSDIIQGQVMDLLNAFFASDVEITSTPAPTIDTDLGNVIAYTAEIQQGKAQTSFSFAWRTEPLSLQDSARMYLLNKVLLHFLVGPLKQYFRDEKGLVYSMSMFQVRLHDTAMISVQTNTATENAATMRAEFFPVFSQLCASLTDDDIQRVINVVRFEAQDNNNAAARVDALDRQLLGCGNFWTIDKELAFICDIKAADLRSFTERIFKHDSSTCFQLG